MAEANTIGAGRFATPLELLGGERVLWSGGAESRGAWIHLGRLLVVFGVPMLFVVGFLLMPIGLAYQSRQAKAQAAEQARREAVLTPAAKPARDGACPVPKDAYAEKSSAPDATGKLLFLAVYAFLVLCLLYFLSMIADCFLRTRNAWYVITSERVCIQSGGWSRSLAVMDLDKVISVKAESTWFEARMGLQSIELTHAGGTQVLRNPSWQLLMPNAYAIAHVPTATPLLSELLNHWLPRDDRHPRA